MLGINSPSSPVHPDNYNSSPLFMASCLATNSQLLGGLWKKNLSITSACIHSPSSPCTAAILGHLLCHELHLSLGAQVLLPSPLLRHSFCNAALTHTCVGRSPPALPGMCGDSSVGQPAQVSAMPHLQQTKGSEIWGLSSIAGLYGLYRDAFQRALG